jgi:hypothetical protein
MSFITDNVAKLYSSLQKPSIPAMAYRFLANSLVLRPKEEEKYLLNVAYTAK